MESGSHVQCPKCGERFEIGAVDGHPDLDPIGMVFEDSNSSRHYFYFNHVAPNCGTTFVIPASEFLPYLHEPVPETSLANTAACTSQCFRLDDLRDCPLACRYAPYRRLLIGMRRRHAENRPPE